MKKIVGFIKSQPVLTAAFAAAVITLFIVPPDAEYLGYCNTTVLIELFALMTAVAGLRGAGLFDLATGFVLRKTGNLRRLGLALTLVCFFSSMLVTNDVALLTMIPLTIMIFKSVPDEKSRIWVIVLETCAANLGSMTTPVGNPQNLFLYDKFGLSAGTFVITMLPAAGISLILLVLLTLLLPKTAVGAVTENTENSEQKKLSKLHIAVFSVLFALCLLAVLRILPPIVCLVAALLAMIIFDRGLFKKVDYALLGTFVCFFVFVGNVARIDAVREFFSAVLRGREIWISALLSQVISNVPAAVMLAGFTENGTGLLLGVNLGGLGTLIASLASLISFQFYRKSEGAKTLRYLAVFSGVNFGLLALLLAAEMLIFT